MVEQEPVFPQEHYIDQLRKCAQKSPVAPIEKKTLKVSDGGTDVM